MAQFVSLDLCLQAIGFLVGMAIIRGLPKETYGQYAVYVGILFATILVSESGLSNLMLNHANRHGDDAKWTSDLCRSGLVVRRRFGLISSGLGACLLAYLLFLNHSPLLLVLLAVTSYLVSMQAVFVRSNCQVFLRMRGLANSSQRALLYAALVRLFVIACVLVASPPSAHIFGVIILTPGTYWIEAWFTSRNLKKLRLGEGSKNNLQIRQLSRAARRLAPMNIATVGREQAFLIIVSLLGSTVVLGEISAFTRFAIAFTLLNSFMLNILLPRIARLDAAAAVKVIPMCGAIYLGVAAIGVFAVHQFAPSLLWLLGGAYAGLEVELVVVMAGSSLLSLCGALAMLGQSHSWLGGAWVSLAGSIAWAASGALFYDLQTTLGAALFVATQGIPVLVAEIVRYVGGARSARRADKVCDKHKTTTLRSSSL